VDDVVVTKDNAILLTVHNGVKGIHCEPILINAENKWLSLFSDNTNAGDVHGHSYFLKKDSDFV